MGARDAWTARPTLTVWVYDSPRGASAGAVRLKRLHREDAVRVEDAVTVSWAPGAHRPRVERLRLGTAAREAGGSSLGAVLGLPPIDRSGEEAAPVPDQPLLGIGIDETFLHEVRQTLVPGSSVMLVLSSRADFDAVRTAIDRGMARGDVRLFHAILSADAVDVLASLARTTAV